jgi:type IV pilus biogenesis protein PilP
MQRLPLQSESSGDGQLRRFLIPAGIVVVLALAGVGFGTHIYLESEDPVPAVQVRPKKMDPALPPQSKTEELKPVASVVPNAGVSATVGQLTALYSAADLKRAEVILLELDKKIRELETSTDPAPVIVASPGAGPSLFPVEPSKSGEVPGQSSAYPKIVAIEGIDGRLQATLSSNSGIQKVHIGDDIDQGRIETITASAVVLRTNSGAKTLLFED